MRTVVLDIETKSPGYDGEGFPPLPLHVPTVISWMVVDTGNQEFQLYAEKCEGREQEVLELLVADMAKADRLVTFNGRGFDLPLVILRCCVNNVTCVSLRDRQHRFNTFKKDLWHYDVLEQFGNYGASRNISLNNLSMALLGRGKTGDGAKAGDMTDEELRSYCACDVYITYECYMKFVLWTQLDKATHRRGVLHLLDKSAEWASQEALLSPLKIEKGKAQEVIEMLQDKFDAEIVEENDIGEKEEKAIAGEKPTDLPPWIVSVGDEPGSCRNCGEVIWWAKTDDGKNRPLNGDGNSHFKTCKEGR